MKQLAHGKGELVRVTAYILLLRPRNAQTTSWAVWLYNQDSNYMSEVDGAYSDEIRLGGAKHIHLPPKCGSPNSKFLTLPLTFQNWSFPSMGLAKEYEAICDLEV